LTYRQAFIVKKELIMNVQLMVKNNFPSPGGRLIPACNPLPGHWTIARPSSSDVCPFPNFITAGKHEKHK
jgi:hypothetical protein